MVDTKSKWEDELGRWLKPFLDRLGHKARRRMCPLYISGLIGPGDRKSVQPMAARLAPGEYDQLHHFIADGLWDAAPLEAELLVQADRLVGRKDAVLVIDDTAMPKKGDRSVGVAPQYASSLGKTANCQTLVSLTLARGEVPVMVALRLFVPESWTSNPVRLKRAGVPVEHRAARTKPEIALAEIDRVMAAGMRFGCVLADAGYGLSAPFRQGLTTRGLTWAVGIPRHQKVYPVEVKLIWPVAGRGLPQAAHSRYVDGGRRHAGQWHVAKCELVETGPRAGWKLASPQFACGPLMDLRSGSRTWASSIFRGTKPGSSANTGRRERRNITSPICRPRQICAR